MGMYAEEDKDQSWDEENDDPRPIAEFAQGENDHHHKGGDSPEAVDDHLPFPIGIEAKSRSELRNFFAYFKFADLPPTHRHARLRERERQEHANGIQWNKRGRFSIEDDDQQRSETGQRQNTPGKHQTTAAIG